MMARDRYVLEDNLSNKWRMADQEIRQYEIGIQLEVPIQLMPVPFVDLSHDSLRTPLQNPIRISSIINPPTKKTHHYPTRYPPSPPSASSNTPTLFQNHSSGYTLHSPPAPWRRPLVISGDLRILGRRGGRGPVVGISTPLERDSSGGRESVQWRYPIEQLASSPYAPHETSVITNRAKGRNERRTKR